MFHTRKKVLCIVAAVCPQRFAKCGLTRFLHGLNSGKVNTTFYVCVQLLLHCLSKSNRQYHFILRNVRFCLFCSCLFFQREFTVVGGQPLRTLCRGLIGGNGCTMPRAPSHCVWRRKVPTMSQVLASISNFTSDRPQVRTWLSNLLLAPGAI